MSSPNSDTDTQGSGADSQEIRRNVAGSNHGSLTSLGLTERTEAGRRALLHENYAQFLSIQKDLDMLKGQARDTIAALQDISSRVKDHRCSHDATAE